MCYLWELLVIFYFTINYYNGTLANFCDYAWSVGNLDVRKYLQDEVVSRDSVPSWGDVPAGFEFPIALVHLLLRILLIL